MARLSRVVVPQIPYHITHRGNRRGRIFVKDADRECYLAFLERYCHAHGLHLWAWCLMTNHIHLIAWPKEQHCIARALGNAHGKYAQWFNAQHNMTGHVWANRFYSTPLDAEHLWAVVRYIELNPVRAEIASSAQEYAWSSAAAHCSLRDWPSAGFGGLRWATSPFPGDMTAAGWASWLHDGISDAQIQAIRRNTMTGRPCGSSDFISHLEARLSRILRPQKVGRKPKCSSEQATEDLFGGI